MYYIYCYENKQNGHKYVGQTNNIERRKREHRSVISIKISLYRLSPINGEYDYY